MCLVPKRISGLISKSDVFGLRISDVFSGLFVTFHLKKKA